MNILFYEFFMGSGSSSLLNSNSVDFVFAWSKINSIVTNGWLKHPLVTNHHQRTELTMTESNLTTNPPKNNYPPYFEMKLVLQQDLMRNVTKDKIKELKLLIEEYQNSYLLHHNISSDLKDMRSMKTVLTTCGDVIKNLDARIAKLMEKEKRIKDKKG